MSRALAPWQVQTEVKGIRLVVRLDVEAGTSVVCDTVRLTQIIHNVVGNAVKFTSEGHVTVELFIGARRRPKQSRLKRETKVVTRPLPPGGGRLNPSNDAGSRGLRSKVVTLRPATSSAKQSRHGLFDDPSGGQEKLRARPACELTGYGSDRARPNP